MIKESFISEEEFEEINKIDIEPQIKEEVKKRNEKLIYTELFENALKNVENKLEKDEIIEFKIIGRSHRSDKLRVAASAAGKYGAYLSNPLLVDWSNQTTLIKTNKRLIAMETAKDFKYLKHYEIKENIKFYDEKNSIFIEMEDLNNNKVIIERNKFKEENVLEMLLEERIKVVKIDKPFKSKEKSFLDLEIKVSWIFWGILLLITIYNLLTNSIYMWNR